MQLAFTFMKKEYESIYNKVKINIQTLCSHITYLPKFFIKDDTCFLFCSVFTLNRLTMMQNAFMNLRLIKLYKKNCQT
jgi:hypothetical protein